MMSDNLKVTVDVENAAAVVQVLKEAQEALAALSAENAALEAQWASVPWATLWLALLRAYDVVEDEETLVQISGAIHWHDENAPKESPAP